MVLISSVCLGIGLVYSWASGCCDSFADVATPERFPPRNKFKLEKKPEWRAGTFPRGLSGLFCRFCEDQRRRYVGGLAVLAYHVIGTISGDIRRHRWASRVLRSVVSRNHIVGGIDFGLA